MYRSRRAAASAILILGVSCGAFCARAFAQGNVLVPSDNDVPLTGAQVQAPAPDQTAPPESSEPPAAAPVRDFSGTPRTDVSPGPAMSIDPNLQVVNMPAAAPESTPAEAGLPYSLRIQIADQYSWSAADALAVQNALGIPPAEMAQHCHLSVAGMARSNKAPGVYAFDLGLMSGTLLPYDGVLTDISLRLHALCDRVPLPPAARYVMQVGDKYAVSLPSIPCAQPPPGAGLLTIHYSGNGNGKCDYQ